MAASLSIYPESGDITAGLDACRVTVTGADPNNDDGTQHRYRLRLDPPAGAETEIGSGYSYLFNVSADGGHEFNNLIFPEAGSWTVRLHDEEIASDAASLAVTVN
jgi:hypothetical protein